MPSGYGDEITFEREDRQSLYAGWYLRPETVDRRRAALLFAQRIINPGLEGRSMARVLWSPSRSALELRIVPPDLLGVLWLQVAEYAQGEVGHRRCAAPGCPHWFPVAPGVGRSDKSTCSPNCRKRLERSRPAKRRRKRRS